MRSNCPALLWALSVAIAACSGSSSGSSTSSSSASSGTSGSTGTTGAVTGSHGSTSGSSSVSSSSSGSTGTTGAEATHDDPRLGAPVALYTTLVSDLTALSNADQKERRVDQFLADVKRAGGAPLKNGGDTLFLFRGNGPANVTGDFNGWSTTSDAMTQVSGTSLWTARRSFDSTERHQYKIFAGGNYLEDPFDPWVQWDGVAFDPNQTLGNFNAVVDGPTNPLTQPEIRRDLFHSSVENNDREIFVYLPPQYFANTSARFGSLYNDDGHEAITRGEFEKAAQDTMNDHSSQAVVMVFVALNSQLDRFNEYCQSPDDTEVAGVQPRADKYAKLLADELVPDVDAHFRTDPVASHRAMMGQSLGGLSSYYVAFTRPETFGLVASQSGTFSWANNEVINDYQNSPKLPLTRLYVDSADTADNSVSAGQMDDVLQSKGYTHERIIGVGDTHDWVYWNHRYHNAMTFLFPGP
jgi:enterochelin esterase-like enzyme